MQLSDLMRHLVGEGLGARGPPFSWWLFTTRDQLLSRKYVNNLYTGSKVLPNRATGGEARRPVSRIISNHFKSLFGRRSLEV